MDNPHLLWFIVGGCLNTKTLNTIGRVHERRIIARMPLSSL